MVVLLVIPSQAHADGPGQQSSSATPQSAAISLYGTTDLVLIEGGESSYSEAFASLDFFYVIVGAGLPGQTHIMAWEPVTKQGYDATIQFNTLLVVTGATIATNQQALTYAKAFAEVANAELNLIRQVISASDLTWLEHSVPNPSVTAVLGGHDVELHTWTATNGVVASWTIRFRNGATQDGSWRVEDVAIGPSWLDLSAAALEPGIRVTNTFGPGGHQQEAVLETAGGTEPRSFPDGEQPPPCVGTGLAGDLVEIEDSIRVNFDDSYWVTCYPAEFVNSNTVPERDQQLAIMWSEAGAESYRRQVDHNATPGAGCSSDANPEPNLGFVVDEPDCRIEIIMDPTSLGSIGPEAAGKRILVHPFSIEVIRAFLTYDLHSDEDVARSIMAHEYFHLLQVDIEERIEDESGSEGGRIPQTLIEGMAHFPMTVINPEVEVDGTGFWYGTRTAEITNTGVNYLQRHPEVGFCDGAPDLQHGPVRRKNDFGLFWGFLYGETGDVGTLRHIYEEAAKNRTCEGALEAITIVLEDLYPSASAFASVDEALLGFGVHMYLRDLRWKPPWDATNYDWGLELLEVRKEPQIISTPLAPQPHTHSVQEWGLQFIELPDTPGVPETYTITFTITEGSAADWRIQVVQESEGSPDITNLIEGVPIVVSPDDRDFTFVQALRTSMETGTYSLTVTKP